MMNIVLMDLVMMVNQALTSIDGDHQALRKKKNVIIDRCNFSSGDRKVHAKKMMRKKTMAMKEHMLTVETFDVSLARCG